MLKYLLDANHLNIAFARTGPVRERVSDAQERGIKVGTCVPVLCEVHAGLVFTKRRDENYALLDEYLRQTFIFSVTRKTARVFGDLFLELRQKGRQLLACRHGCRRVGPPARCNGGDNRPRL